MTTLARRREHDSGDYSDASHHENDQDTTANGTQNDESDYDSAASDSEPSERDPESQETERRVDDDEDRSNPQYIPKRGTFYEHDDRTAASGGEESTNTRDGASETASEKRDGETSSERRRGPRKSESVNKWSHDKYNENEQVPKSRDELVAIYGYDIRNEDAPPHARRNRRYGRGPNKYTRTWEDEEAYKRQANAAPPVRKPPNPEDFPELEASNRGGKRAPRPRSKSQPSSGESIENGNLRRNDSIKDRARARRPPARTPVKDKKENRDREGQKENRESREKLPPLENLTITASVVNNSASQPARKVNATVAQQRPVPTEQGKKKPPPPAPQQPQPTAAPAKSPPQPAPPKPQPQREQREQSQPQAQEPRGSKRYSSLRQRPLDTYTPPQQQKQQQHRYGEFPSGAGGAGGGPHQGSPAPQIPHPQQLMQQMHRNAPVNQQHGPSPPHQLPQQQMPQQQQLPQQQIPQQQIPQQQQIQQQQIQQQQISQQQQQVRLGILEQQQLVQHHNMQHLPPQVPQHSIAQLQQTQAYAPPAMMPAQYMQQAGVGGAFSGAALYAGVGVGVGVGGVAAPAAPHPHYPHQLYPHHNYVAAVSIADTPHNYVQPAGGVTYYSPAEQETLPRAQRRPTAAIPIVRPAAPERPANSSEKDNIDRIVENMFVRKPWPNSLHGADSKEKSETRNSQEPQSKESSQPNSLTSSSISTDSKPSESIEKEIKEQEKEIKEVKEVQKEKEATPEVEPQVQTEEQKELESISTDA